MSICIGASPLKEAYVGSTPIKEIYVGTTKVRPVDALPYDNIYVFFDGIYTGTDSSPKTTKLYSDNTIRACFFDRETRSLWLGKTNGIGYYSFDTKSYTSVMSATINYDTNDSYGFLFLKDYLAFRGSSSPLYVIDRKNRTYLRSITFDTSSYSFIGFAINYDYNYNYINKNHGKRQTYITSLETGNDIRSIFSTAYHQCCMFNGKFYISCENGSNNGRVYSSSGSYVQATSGSNMGYSGISHLVDSGHITKVTSTDYEYDRIILGPTRRSTASKIIKGGTTLESDYTGAEHGNFIKYNDAYSIVQYDYDQRDSYNFGFAVRDKSSGTLTRHSFGLSTRRNISQTISITQKGNLGFYRIGIFNINGNSLYSSDEFVGCVSNKVYEGPSSTVVCDFKASGGGTTTVNDLLVKGDFCSQRDGKTSMTTGDNGTLRLLIAATDYSAGIYLGGGERDGAITNKGYSNGASFANGLKQNLIKKAYLKMSNLYDSKVTSSGNYPIFNRGGIFAEFNKRVNSTNRVSDTGTAQSWCGAGFYFPRGDYSSYARYIIKPIDANTQYLALPTTQNLGENHTATGYVDQGVSCLYSRLTLETRGTDPSNFHYRLIVGATGNEYDLGLCSSLGSCHLAKDAGDWRKAGSYVEIDEAYLEFFDDYYIDENGNITTTKPR